MKTTFIKTQTLKQKPEATPAFGTVFTDYMIEMRCENGNWGEMVIKPYAPFVMDPASIGLHYGQAIFEGLKAYKTAAGGVNLFRPELNVKRMNKSCERLCIPVLPEKTVLDGILELASLEREWIPSAPGTALYIRPAIIATDVSLGVHSSKSYIFYVILSPVGAYYTGGLSPVNLKVEDVYVRSCIGGTGEAKFAGNYAASLLSGEAATREGFDQVMWLDARERKWVEEVGSMNIFFVIDGKVVTPKLNGSILPGITRRSAIELLAAQGINVFERAVSIDEVLDGILSNTLTECFGTGTAAVISPVGNLSYRNKKYSIGGGKMGPVAAKIYDDLTGIQSGTKPDTLGWIVKI